MKILRIFNKILVVILIFMIVYTVSYVEPVKVEASGTLVITGAMLTAAATALVASGLVASSAENFTQACELFVYDMFNKDNKLFKYFEKCAVAGVFFFNLATKLFTRSFVNELKDGTAMTSESSLPFYLSTGAVGQSEVDGVLYTYSNIPQKPYFHYQIEQDTSYSGSYTYIRFKIKRNDIYGNALSIGTFDIAADGIFWGTTGMSRTKLINGSVFVNSFFYNRVTRSWILRYNNTETLDLGQYQFTGECTSFDAGSNTYAKYLRGYMSWLTPLPSDTYSIPNDPGLTLEAYNDVAVKTNEYVNSDGITLPVTGVNDLVNVDTSVDTLVQTTDYPLDDTQTDTGVDTGTITGALSDFFKVDSLDLTGFQNLAITNKFPFCIPFDLVQSIQMFSAQAKDPKFEIKLDGQFLKVDHEIDLSRFNFILGFFRYFVVMCFVWFLINKTRDFIKW